MIHLRVQSPFRQRLLQLMEKPVALKCRLRVYRLFAFDLLSPLSRDCHMNPGNLRTTHYQNPELKAQIRGTNVDCLDDTKELIEEIVFAFFDNLHFDKFEVDICL
ncbi:hypothetical protein [Rhizobium ruizarguesonis]|uniref:hypothetical protein n=1 Tax=Rhizobium ruizarguesonis TaxID=2081791 RepID=UPI0037149D4B